MKLGSFGEMIRDKTSHLHVNECVKGSAAVAVIDVLQQETYHIVVQSDHEKQVHRAREAKEAAASGKAGQPVSSLAAGDVASLYKKQDLSLKEGETIKYAHRPVNTPDMSKYLGHSDTASGHKASASSLLLAFGAWEPTALQEYNQACLQGVHVQHAQAMLHASPYSNEHT